MHWTLGSIIRLYCKISQLRGWRGGCTNLGRGGGGGGGHQLIKS